MSDPKVITSKPVPRKSRISKTIQHTQPRTNLTIDGKDPNMDYSFRPIKDIEEGRGQDLQGYVPIDAGNEKGETWGGPKSFQRKTKGFEQIRYMDTVACKRTMEQKKYFDDESNRRYNTSKEWTESVSNEKMKLDFSKIRKNSKVTTELEITGRGFTQRPGPTLEE